MHLCVTNLHTSYVSWPHVLKKYHVLQACCQGLESKRKEQSRYEGLRIGPLHVTSIEVI